MIALSALVLLNAAVFAHEVRHVPSASETVVQLREVSGLLVTAPPAALARLVKLSAALGAGAPAVTANFRHGVNGAVIALRSGDAAEATRLVTRLLADAPDAESGTKHTYQIGYNAGYNRGYRDGQHGHYNNNNHTGNPQYDHGWRDGYDAGYNASHHGH